MKKFFILVMICLVYGNISDIIFKLKSIQNSKKIFLNYPIYNIFYLKKISKTNEKKKFFHNNHKNKLKIFAIFNNKVNINGIWKKEGDIIDGFKIIQIRPSYVVLKRGKVIKILKFNTKVIKVQR